MSFITELDVVNDCLATLGESPLNAVNEDHPYVAAALRALRIANGREQAKGWWFNRELVELHPQPGTGFVYVPEDTINVDPSDPWTNLVQRGRRLYNPSSAAPYRIGCRVVCRLLRRLPFEDLPPQAQTYISYSTQLDFQKNYDADRAKADLLMRDKQQAYMDLRAEDIRNVGANLLYSPSNLAKMQSLGLLEHGGSGRLGAYYGPTGISPPATAPGGEGIDPNTLVPDFAGIFEDAVEV